MSTIPIDPFLRIYNRIADGGEICSGDFDPKNNPEDRKRLLIGTFLAILFVIIFVVFSSCTRKVYIPVERTTTVVEHLVDTVIEVKLKEYRDTITIENTGKDTLSYLSNPYGYSFASIEGGKLGHSLGILPGAFIKETVKIKYIFITDSIPYPVEVEKKLSMWQSIKIEYGGIAMGAAFALGFVLFLFAKYNRRKE